MVTKEKIAIAAIFIVAIVVVVGFSAASPTGATYQESKYGHATWRCADGANFDQRGCKTYSAWGDYAQTICNSHCVRNSSSGYRQCNTGNLQVSDINCNLMVLSLLKPRRIVGLRS